jgi:hypothetical protein
MPKDINLSTLLLLGVLLFLIYCLLKEPKQVSLANSENFENETVSEAGSEAYDEASLNDEENIENFESEQEEVPTSRSEKTRDFTSQPPRVPEVSSDLVNQVVNDSESKQGAVNSTLLGTGSSIHNFEPNDDNMFKGAALDNAFERPIADKSDTDTIDLKKNNVTNYKATDYLPKEINDDWFNTDFSQAKYKMNDDKLINTDKYIIGINTVGQSLKNASYDIRGSINVPKYTVSPWNNSTVEPDYNIKPLC